MLTDGRKPIQEEKKKKKKEVFRIDDSFHALHSSTFSFSSVLVPQQSDSAQRSKSRFLSISAE